ncbi:MAG: response regulator [Hyphomicrobiaceae bacterium]
MDRASTPHSPIVAVIENDQVQARCLSILLKDWGYDPVCGASASEIARALGRRVALIEAIVADYELDDGLTGLRAAESLSVACGRKIPTVVTTGHRHQAEHENRFAVLQKPFDPTVLHDWLITHTAPRSSEGQISAI